jgi:4'-phosphopantetheinyl transferase
VAEHGAGSAAFEALGAARPAEHPAGAVRIPLSEPGVHVWRVPLNAGSPGVSDIVALLSPQERDRMSRFRLEADRRRYGIVHAALRLLLGRYLGLDPRDLAFAAGEHGKPHLASAPAIEFNLSHSGDLALIAVSPNRPVGVDVESLARRIPDVPPLARRVLCPREREWLSRIGERSRAHAFLQLWACKEAVSKAAGRGFTIGFARIETDPDPLFSERSQHLQCAGGHWRLHVLEPGDGYVGALAVAVDPAPSG